MTAHGPPDPLKLWQNFVDNVVVCEERFSLGRRLMSVKSTEQAGQQFLSTQHVASPDHVDPLAKEQTTLTLEKTIEGQCLNIDVLEADSKQKTAPSCSDTADRIGLEANPLLKPGEPVWLTREGCQSNDIRAFQTRLSQLVDARGYQIRTLGQVAGIPIELVVPKKENGGPHIIIAAGFHGEEPAGPWGLLRFLEDGDPQLLRAVNVSFIPLINPTGFVNSRRVNDLGQDPNRGYTTRDPALPSAPKDLVTTPSPEGLILKEHLPDLLKYGSDGFISLHEDCDVGEFYLYTYEKHPRVLTGALRTTLAGFFPPLPGDNVYGVPLNNAVAESVKDGSFESFLFEQGIPRIFTTESAGKAAIDKRCECNAAVARKYVEKVLTYTSHGVLVPDHGQPKNERLCDFLAKQIDVLHQRPLDSQEEVIVERMVRRILSLDLMPSGTALGQLPPHVAAAIILAVVLRRAHFPSHQFCSLEETDKQIEKFLPQVADQDSSAAQIVWQVLDELEGREGILDGVALDLKHTVFRQNGSRHFFADGETSVLEVDRSGETVVVRFAYEGTEVTVGLSQLSSDTLGQISAKLCGSGSSEARQLRRACIEHICGKSEHLRKGRARVDAVVTNALTADTSDAISTMPTDSRSKGESLLDNALSLPNGRQATSSWCGAKCVQLVAAYFGKSADREDEFADRLGTSSEHGTLPESIAKVLNDLDVSAEVKDEMSFKELERIVEEERFPVIVAFQAWKDGSNRTPYRDDWLDGHYSVVIRVTDDYVVLEDPSLNGQRGVLTKDEFLQRWHDIDGLGRVRNQLGVIARSSPSRYASESAVAIL